MSITRRGFLGAILASGTAPAVVKAQILMPVKKIILPNQEDTVIPGAWVIANGRAVYRPDMNICKLHTYQDPYLGKLPR